MKPTNETKKNQQQKSTKQKTFYSYIGMCVWNDIKSQQNHIPMGPDGDDDDCVCVLYV